jgi:DNA polymerase-3 subunit alpha
VRFGLGTIKNVGEGAANLIVTERQEHGPYKSLDDLCERVDLRTVNRRVLEALTKSGALDDFGPRERILAALDQALAAAQQAQKAAGIGQQSLFGGDSGAATATALPVVPAPTDRERLTWEKETLGFFLSGHPFESAARALAGRITANTSQVTDEMKDERVTMAGAIVSLRKIMTRKGEQMAVVQLEDLHGSIEAVVFPRTFAANPEIWREDNVVVIGGKITLRSDNGGRGEDEGKGRPEVLVDHAEEWVPDPNAPAFIEEEAPVDSPALIADTVSIGAVEVIDSDAFNGGEALGGDLIVDAGAAVARAFPGTRLTIEFYESRDRASDLDRLRRLHALLARSTGEDPYAIVFVAGNRRSRLVGEQLRIRYTPDLARALQQIVGPGSVKVAPNPESVEALT